ncbi:uncharacterized protein LOC125240845 [Leguminivora glycinivorella]|uniref:uncharacterized protein LOC125240845 n=1 Tax=Leguminivora glycinivorella TaxID=1035111 RepID=UPI00200CEE8A|nr:uncharacterized protein LOC125240845 [Leguminivora glycinivorella]
MSSELSQLKANRGYHKGAITRIGTFCMSEDFKTASIELILQKKDRLIKSFNDYELCNRAILALEPEDDESYESYETKRDLCLALIETRLKQVSPAAQATPSSELETKKRAIALEATSTEEPKKTVKSTVSAAATMGVSCVPVCLQAADTCGSLLGEDEIRSYCRREAALPCWQEVYK